MNLTLNHWWNHIELQWIKCEYIICDINWWWMPPSCRFLRFPGSGRIANTLFQLAGKAFDHGLDGLELLLLVIHFAHVVTSNLLSPHFSIPVHEDVHHHDVVLARRDTLWHTQPTLRSWFQTRDSQKTVQSTFCRCGNIDIWSFECRCRTESLSWNSVVRSARLVALAFCRILICFISSCCATTPRWRTRIIGCQQWKHPNSYGRSAQDGCSPYYFTFLGARK